MDENKYIWKKWQQPIFTGDDTWGEVSATSVHEVLGTDYSPYHTLDEDEDTHWEGAEGVVNAQLIWKFDKPLKVYRIELTNKPTGSIHITKTVEVYVNEELTEPLLTGEFPAESKGRCDLEPEVPLACDCIILNLMADAESGVKYVGLTDICIIAEVGEEKTVLIPFLNTADDMEVISGSYNDDSTFQTDGLDGFMFSNRMANPLFISSNHWIGFGTNAEQLRICRRDGCSTAIYRQIGETTNGLTFLKIRFEGYTAYNNRVEETRLIFEFFLMSNNDMFLNVIQTPTNAGYLGTSDLICNSITTPLTLADGSGGGTVVSFYHQDDIGCTWNIVYAMYETIDYYSFAYLLQADDIWYSVVEDALVEVPIETLTAAMFLKYGTEELPSKGLLTPIVNPHIYLWKAGGEQTLLKDTVKAYPYPHIITSEIDMSHISILGIHMMTAQYSGTVGVCISLDNGEMFSEEMAMDDWLNTEPQELWESLNEEKRLILQFVLHDNATITSFKITYEN